MQALLLVSYGAPERQEEVVPFLNNLFAGKNVPTERIATAVQKYEKFAAKTGHYSPLNSECRKLIEGIRQEWQRNHHNPLPVYWGNLFGQPLLVDTIAQMTQDGIKRAACFATSAFDSPSGNKRYADALESARKTVGVNAPILEKLPLSFEHPLFIEAQAERLLESTNILAGTPARMGTYKNTGNHPCPSTGGELGCFAAQKEGCFTPFLRSKSFNSPPVEGCPKGRVVSECIFRGCRILFSAHSIPLVDAAQSHYVEQLQSTCRLIIEKSGMAFPWELVYQSRSGPAEHWLGPDIKERIGTLAAEGLVRSVIVSPIGFFCENMETENDLDIEVGECCAELGIALYRSKAVGAMPPICRMIVELIRERA